MKFDTLQDHEFRRDEWDARERDAGNQLSESVLTAPIEDLEDEIRAEGGDPREVAEATRLVMRKAILQSQLKDIRARRSRADIEATHLRFPDELAPRWRDVDVLLELLSMTEVEN